MNDSEERQNAKRSPEPAQIPMRNESPFDPAFDPDRKTSAINSSSAGQSDNKSSSENAGCHCGFTRRQTLALAASLAALPMAAAAQPLISSVPFVPCEQTQQQITPCRHKFCRFYRGSGDYHGR